MTLTPASPPAALPTRIPGPGVAPPGGHHGSRGRPGNGFCDGSRRDLGPLTICRRRRFRGRWIASRHHPCLLLRPSVLLLLIFILDSPCRTIRPAALAPVLGFDRRNRRVPKCFPVELDARVSRLEGAHDLIVEGLAPDLHIGRSTEPVEDALVRFPVTAGNRLDQVDVLVPAPVT
jgi:hypothetical protein